jgi:hypothetical protein
MQVIKTDSAAYLALATVATETSVIGAYAAYTGAFARIEGFEEYGFASKQVTPIGIAIAKARMAADAWGALDDSARMAKIKTAENAAKRYAEKAVRICKALASNTVQGLSLSELRAAESDEVAGALVKAFFLSKDLYTQDSVFEFFGFAATTQKPKEEREGKGGNAPATTPAPAPVPEADNIGEIAPANADALMAHVRAVLAMMPESERVKFASAMLPELRAMAKPKKETATA